MRYLNESLTRLIFFPIILPLTSTTQTISIGDLCVCYDFDVMILNTDGTI